MTKDGVLAARRVRADELPAKGVAHAALYGSMARREPHPGSDLDIAVDLDPTAGLGEFIEAAADQGTLQEHRS